MMDTIFNIILNKHLWWILFFIRYHFCFLFLILLLINIYSGHYFFYLISFLFLILYKHLRWELFFLFDINHILINGFSLIYGLISSVSNSASPYPGKDFTIILLLLSIWLACFFYISSNPFLFNFSVIHP